MSGDKVCFRFSANNGILSRGIRFYTWPSEYSHVDLVVPGEGLLGAMPDGVKLRPFNYDHPTKLLYAWVDVNDSEKIYTIAKSQTGKRYDFGAIFGLALHHDWQDAGQWFCSELATWLLLQDEIHILNPGIPYSSITPGMMLSSVALDYGKAIK